MKLVIWCIDRILTTLCVDTFFSVGANEDPKNSEIVSTTLSNGRLSLPEREYYFDPNLKTTMQGLEDVITSIFEHFDYSHADSITMANDAVYVETLLAQSFCHFAIDVT